MKKRNIWKAAQIPKYYNLAYNSKKEQTQNITQKVKNVARTPSKMLTDPSLGTTALQLGGSQFRLQHTMGRGQQLSSTNLNQFRNNDREEDERKLDDIKK